MMKDHLATGTVALLAGLIGFGLAKWGRNAPTTKREATTIVETPVTSILGDVPSFPSTPSPKSTLSWRTEEIAEANAERLSWNLRSLGKLSNPIDRAANLTALLSQLSASNLNQVLAAFEGIPPIAENLNEYQLLLSAWARFDREGAMRYASALAAKNVSGGLPLSEEELMKPILASWSSEDPAGALAWFEALPPEQQTHHLKMSLLSGWASNNPNTAAAYLQNQPADQNREYLVGQITSQLFQQNRQGAATWAESIKDTKLKEQVFEELAEDWVSVDPKGLASWLGKHLNDSYAWEAIEDLARGWVANDSTAATDWIEALPDGPAKQKGIQKMVQSWADNDLYALGDWLNNLPDSPVADLGVKAFAERLQGQAPEAALQSAMSMNNDDMRNETVHELAQEWYSHDQEAAVQWANANHYPVDALERTADIYLKINQEQLNQLNKEINRDQLPPERLAALREEQQALQAQAAQLQEIAPAVAKTPKG